jgi:hypothetical protein
MSTTRSGAARAPELSDWDRLELAVRRLLDYQEALTQRAQAAERRIGELEAGIAEVSAGRLDPVALSERAAALELENRALEERLGQARDAVQRILTRLRFAEEDS